MSELAKALVKAQKSFGPALKTSTNPHFRTKYADLSSCVDAVLDGLNSNGIALLQDVKNTDHGVSVTTVFLHESGEKMELGNCTVPVSKNDPQGYGSALTYARRYSLSTACGIAPEDDDGNAAQKSLQAKAPTKPLSNEVAKDMAQEELKDFLRKAQEVKTVEDLKAWYAQGAKRFSDVPGAKEKIIQVKDMMKEELSLNPPQKTEGLNHIAASLPQVPQ